MSRSREVIHKARPSPVHALSSTRLRRERCRTLNLRANPFNLGVSPHDRRFETLSTRPKKLESLADSGAIILEFLSQTGTQLIHRPRGTDENQGALNILGHQALIKVSKLGVQIELLHLQR